MDQRTKIPKPKASALLAKPLPAAPAVYRPQPAPRILQRKSAGQTPNTPPRYCPQSLPRVLQLREVNSRFPHATSAAAQSRPRPETQHAKSPHTDALSARSRVPHSNNRFPTIQRSSISNSSSSESCQARLKIADQWYEGSTTHQRGHAEMDALHVFIEAFGSVDDAIKKFDRARSKLVDCPGKEVCARCGAVLQELGFKVSDDKTTWGTKNMGGTQWGASQNVQEFLKNKGVDFKTIAS